MQPAGSGRISSTEEEQLNKLALAAIERLQQYVLDKYHIVVQCGAEQEFVKYRDGYPYIPDNSYSYNPGHPLYKEDMYPDIACSGDTARLQTLITPHLLSDVKTESMDGTYELVLGKPELRALRYPQAIFRPSSIAQAVEESRKALQSTIYKAGQAFDNVSIESSPRAFMEPELTNGLHFHYSLWNSATGKPMLNVLSPAGKTLALHCMREMLEMQYAAYPLYVGGENAYMRLRRSASTPKRIGTIYPPWTFKRDDQGRQNDQGVIWVLVLRNHTLKNEIRRKRAKRRGGLCWRATHPNPVIALWRIVFLEETRIPI